MKLKTLSLLLLLALLAIGSCKKDLPDPSPSAATPDAVAQAFARLKTQQERNFFEKNYVTNHHPFLLQAIKSRGPEEDSLVNEVLQHLLLLNQSNPFLMNVIDHFGYPVWNRSKIVTGVDNPAYRAVLTPYAKMQENQISGYSIAFPSPLDFTEWHVLIVHRDEIDTLIQAPASCEVTNLVWHVAQKLYFDKQLFGTQQLNLKEWFLGCMGDGDGFARTQQIQERCFTIDLGECVNTAFAPTEGQIEDRDPCGAGQVWISNNVSVGCGELGSSNAPMGGGAWIGTLGGGGGSTSGSTGGGGNGTSTSTNEETVIDLYSKYGECLLANPDIANAVWQKENSFPQDLSLIRQVLDKVLEMICSEGEGQYMTPEIFESEYNRALCEFAVQNPERILFSPLRYNTTFMMDCVLQAVFPPELYAKVMELKVQLGLSPAMVLFLFSNQNFTNRVSQIWDVVKINFTNPDLEDIGMNLKSFTEDVMEDLSKLNYALDILEIVESTQDLYPDVFPDLTEALCCHRFGPITKLNFQTASDQQKINRYFGIWFMARRGNCVTPPSGGSSYNGINWNDAFSMFGHGCGLTCHITGSARVQKRFVPLYFMINEVVHHYFPTERQQYPPQKV